MTITVSGASAAAIEAVQKAGGSVTTTVAKAEAAAGGSADGTRPRGAGCQNVRLARLASAENRRD